LCCRSLTVNCTWLDVAGLERVGVTRGTVGRFGGCCHPRADLAGNKHGSARRDCHPNSASCVVHTGGSPARLRTQQLNRRSNPRDAATQGTPQLKGRRNSRDAATQGTQEPEGHSGDRPQVGPRQKFEAGADRHPRRRDVPGHASGSTVPMWDGG